MADQQETIAPTKGVESQVLQIADDQTHVRPSLVRSTTRSPTAWDDPNTQVGVYTFQSNDGGASWFLIGAYTTHGGVVMDKDTGQEATETFQEFKLHPAKGRMVKHSVILLTGSTIPLDLKVSTFSDPFTAAQQVAITK